MKVNHAFLSEVHLNPTVQGLTPSATLAINERSDRLRREGRQIFKLGLGQSPFPVPRPVVEALQANAHQKDYLPVKGLPALREAVAGFHRRIDELACRGDDVLVGPGSKELMFLLQLVYEGELAIPAPSWVSYAPQARIVGRRIHWLPTRAEHGWLLMPEDLERLGREDPGRPRLVILNYPSNPTGYTYRIETLQALSEVAQHYGMLVLSDEIYGELFHSGGHRSLAPFYPEGTLVSSGLSKWCGAGGWRLGTFVFPPDLRWLLDAMAAVASETFTATSAPIQYAAVRAFEGGPEIDDYLRRSRRVLAALGAHCAARLREAGARAAPPHGAFYLFPDLSALAEPLRARGIATSTALCERLLEDTGVATLPGADFGRPPDELTLRLAYVDFDGAQALDAAAGLPDEAPLPERFLQAHCGNVVEAIDRMCGWLAV